MQFSLHILENLFRFRLPLETFALSLFYIVRLSFIVHSLVLSVQLITSAIDTVSKQFPALFL